VEREERADEASHRAVLKRAGLPATEEPVMEIKLLEAKAVPDTALWGRWDHVRFTLAVEDLGYEKEVAIHLSDGREYPARYLEPLCCHYELWECAIPIDQRDLNLQFALRYTVNGRTYWDNNHGWDYALNPSQPELRAGVFPTSVAA
jgi:hypothetical protein